MKNTLQILSILLLTPFATIAQNILTIDGLVQSNESPIANAMVTIIGPSTPAIPGDTIEIVYTDENGIFYSNTDLELAYSEVTVHAETCPNFYILDNLTYPSSNTINLNCDSLPPNFYCLSYFYFIPDSVEDGFIYYINASQGENLNFIWNFGDGTQSFEPYPTHIYEDAEAEYNVCLIITGNDCQDQYCTTVSGTYDGDPDGPGLTGDGNQSQQGEGAGTGFTFVVLENISTGIQDQLEKIDFNIFPNPSSGILSLNINTQNNGTVSILDLSGKMVYERNNVNPNNSQLDLGNLNDGIYIVQFRNENSIATRKLILQR